MKKTQGAVQDANHQQAARMREEKDAAKRWFFNQQDEFLAGQHEKVLRGHQQAIERQQAITTLQQAKRKMGSEMREELQKGLVEATQIKRDYVAASHNTVFDARRKKQSAVRARLLAEREQAIATGKAAKIARAKRKEQTKATVRREVEAARNYTAQVRYETRPEVRREGAEMFQQQRNRSAEETREQSEADAETMARAQAKYLAAAEQVKQKVGSLHASTKASRESLAEARRQNAKDVRTNLRNEAERKKQLDADRYQNKQQLHDEIHSWSKSSVLDI